MSAFQRSEITLRWEHVAVNPKARTMPRPGTVHEASKRIRTSSPQLCSRNNLCAFYSVNSNFARSFFGEQHAHIASSEEECLPALGDVWDICGRGAPTSERAQGPFFGP